MDGSGTPATSFCCVPPVTIPIRRPYPSNIPPPDIPVLAKPNAGMPIIAEDGQAVYQMEPEDFARHMMALASQGATLLGGCCGTTPAFIKALAQRLSARG